MSDSARSEAGLGDSALSDDDLSGSARSDDGLSDSAPSDDGLSDSALSAVEVSMCFVYVNEVLTTNSLKTIIDSMSYHIHLDPIIAIQNVNSNVDSMILMVISNNGNAYIFTILSRQYSIIF